MFYIKFKYCCQRSLTYLVYLQIQSRQLLLTFIFLWSLLDSTHYNCYKSKFQYLTVGTPSVDLLMDHCYTEALREVTNLAEKLAKRKTQKILLESGCDPTFTSLNLKVGRKFKRNHEKDKLAALHQCTKQLIQIGISEASEDIHLYISKKESLFQKYASTFSKEQYFKLNKAFQKEELFHLKK